MKVETIENSYNLSPIQQGMLFHSLYAQESGVDIEQLVCKVHELDIPAFKQAWQKVVERHPVLRTSFDWQNDQELRQFVHRVMIPLEQQDWRAEPAQEQQQRLQVYLQLDRQRGFQLNQVPLMRLALFRLSESDYQFVWTFHHALLDGRSLLIVLKEVFAFYDACCQGEDLQLAQPRPYCNHIEWLQQQDWSKAESFWRKWLQGFTAPTPLVVDTPKADEDQVQQWGEQQIRLTATTTAMLRSLAQQHQLTLNTLVQGAWALLLSRYSGETDVVFGATRACRRSSVAGAESMVGVLINTLPVRVRVSPEIQLLPWLKEVRSQWMVLRDYEHTPLVNIQGWSEVSGGTLFHSILVFENYELNSALRSEGGRWENLEVRLMEQPNYPLTFAAYGGTELLLQLHYDRQRFDDATIGRMLRHLQTLLSSMATDPWQCLGELPMLTADERHQMLVEWNNTQADFPQQLCIHQLFEAQVERTPDAIAVVFEDEQLTYRQLNQRANRLAHHLQHLGVGAEMLVGICVERSLDLVVGLLGILKAGGAYLPLDPTYPQDRLSFMLEDAQVSVLLSQQHLVERLAHTGAKIVCLDSSWDAPHAQQSQENPTSEVKSDNLAYMIYTSGSTGKPKGVMIQHQSIVNYAIAASVEFALGERDRVLQFASICFDVAAEEIFPCLLQGATLVLRTDTMLHSISVFLQKCSEWGLTVLALPTAYWHEITTTLSTDSLTLPPSLRLVIIGGEKAHPEHLLTWQKHVGQRIQLLNAYGPTEATVVSTIYDLSSAEINEVLPVPIGRAIRNVQTYVLDRQMQPVPIGVRGELHIGGTGLARGYYNRPELTQEKFIPHPFSTDSRARLYKTGDLVRYLEDGNIEFLGRIDHQVKIRGFRIELGEIEAVLAQHSAVLHSMVIAWEDRCGDKRLVAYVIPQKLVPTASELRRFLKEKLPDYMVPANFVFLDALPLTPNGKVDRQALPEPNQARNEQEETFVAPQDELELQLTEIWEKVLGTKPSVKDNFFDLGGHSLTAVRLFAQIEQTFGKNLPLATLFQAPTIEQLATILRQKKWSAPCSSIVTIQAGSSSHSPLFCIHGGGFNILAYLDVAHYLEPERPVYGIQAKGLEGKEAPHRRVEDMATDYIKQMRAVQPQGPYFLAGLSSGGIIALEMAQQLHLQGQEVSLLAIFDSYGPDGLKLLPPIPRLGSILGYAVCCSVPRFLGKLMRLQPQAMLTQVTQKLKIFQSMSYEQRSEATAKHLRILPSDDGTCRFSSNSSYLERCIDNLSMFVLEFSPWAFLAPEAELQSIGGSLHHTLKKIEEAHSKAHEEYVPKPYPGRITLFKASEQPPGFYTDPQLGWGSIAAEGVEIYHVPGHHSSIIKSPVLAKKLRDCLVKAQTKD